MILMKVLYWKSEVQFIVRKENFCRLLNKTKLKSGETYIFENTSGAIESPDLWSPETPSLYLVKLPW